MDIRQMGPWQKLAAVIMIAAVVVLIGMLAQPVTAALGAALAMFPRGSWIVVAIVVLAVIYFLAKHKRRGGSLGW